MLRAQATPLALRRHRLRWRKLTASARGLVAFVVVVVVWQLVAMSGLYKQVLFPGPAVVWAATVQLLRSGVLLTNTLISLEELAIGFGISLVLATVLGIAAGLSRRVSDYVDPFVHFLQAIPGIAWVPLALVWFGFGAKTITFVIFTGSFFPLLFNVMGGVRQSDPIFVQAAMTLGARRLEVIRDVVLPGALPSFITGITIAVGNGFRALVAAEMIAGTTGLGFMLANARAYLRTDQVICGMIVVGLLWLGIDQLLLRPLESLTVERWGLVH